MYDIEYFYNMLRMYAPTAKQICEARWTFVCQDLGNWPKTVLDYGSGCGFFKAFAPKGVQVDTYDIMHVPQTGITRETYDLVTLWDVLEHIPNLMELEPIFKRAMWAGITVPIKPPGLAWSEYKHFKPGEHIHHFQRDYLEAVMDLFGFTLVREGTPECPPREMIGSFLFKRVGQ
jgi:hypothetical protein